MSKSLAQALDAANAVSLPASTAARVSGERPKRLKLDLSERLVATRERHGISQVHVHDRQQLVSDWENPDRPHAPNAMHMRAAAEDDVSLPYAVEACRFVLAPARLDGRYCVSTCPPQQPPTREPWLSPLHTGFTCLSVSGGDLLHLA